jgi:hypothetical protein
MWRGDLVGVKAGSGVKGRRIPGGALPACVAGFQHGVHGLYGNAGQATQLEVALACASVLSHLIIVCVCVCKCV